MSMQLRYRLKYRILIALVIVSTLLIFQFQTISSAGEGDGFVDISKTFGFENGKVFGKGINISNGILTFFDKNSQIILNKGEPNEIVLNEGQDIQISKSMKEITFTGKESKISINGNKFENIVPNAKNSPAYIDLDAITGKISQARFKASADGEYTINGASFSTKSDSIVDYGSAMHDVLFMENAKIKNIIEPITIKGYDVELSEGYTLRIGDLNFDGKGNSFLKGGQDANINGVNSFVVPSSKSNLFISFDKEASATEDSLVFTKDKLKLSSNGDIYTPFIVFKENNPYLKMEQGDKVDILPSKNTKIEIDSKSSTEFIPSMSVLNGDFDLAEDGKTIRVKDGFFSLDESTSDGTTTSPLEVVLRKDIPGVNGKLIVDNFNRMAIIPQTQSEYFADYEGLNVKFSSKLKYNYLNENNIENLIGIPVTFSSKTSEGNQQMVLGRLRDYWNVLTPETQDAVKQIEISNKKVETMGKNVAAFAWYPDQRIVFKESSDSYNLEDFRHEAAHLRDFEITQEFKTQVLSNDKGYTSLKQEQENVLKKIIALDESGATPDPAISQEYINEYTALKKKIEFIEQDSDVSNTFQIAWEKVAGEYDKSKTDKDGYSVYTGTLAGIDSSMASGGYIRAYGAKNIAEDIATFNEEISNPQFFKPLLNNLNPYKDVYLTKLNLLYQYKFISKEEYDAIINAAK